MTQGSLTAHACEQLSFADANAPYLAEIACSGESSDRQRASSLVAIPAWQCHAEWPLVTDTLSCFVLLSFVDVLPLLYRLLVLVRSQEKKRESIGSESESLAHLLAKEHVFPPKK